MKDGDCACFAVPAHEHDREAVGGHREDRKAGRVRPQSVRALAPGSRRRLHNAGGMHLVVERELLHVGADRPARDPAVLVHALDDVATLAAEVE